MNDDKLDLILAQIQLFRTDMQREILSLKFELNDRFTELKKSIDSQHLDNVTTNESIWKTLLEYKSAITDEIVTHEHQFNVMNNRLLRLEAEIDRIKSR